MWVRYPDMADCLPGWAVIDDLDDLRGPAGGVVSLPVQLYWGATSEFDLDQPGQLRPYLQAVLREALNEGHLASYINRAVLEREWGRLRLPDSLRRAWAEIHPGLGMVEAVA